MSGILSAVFVILLACSLTEGHVVLFNSSAQGIPSSVSSGCRQALSSPIECDPMLLRYASGGYVGSIKPAVLEDTICCQSCASSLATYHNNVVRQCGPTEVVPGFPATYNVDFIWAYQNQTCLREPSGDFCINKPNNITRKKGERFEDLPQDVVCSPCMIARFKQSQASSFGNYNGDMAKSWAKIQSICSIEPCETSLPKPATNKHRKGGSSAGKGASVTTAEQGIAKPRGCRSGKTHTTKENETCRSISEDYSISTGLLAILNGLYADCANLQPDTELCLPQSCDTYCVQKGDTCFSIGKEHGVRWTKVISLNPNLNRDCTNLIPGDTICLTPPRRTPGKKEEL